MKNEYYQKNEDYIPELFPYQKKGVEWLASKQLALLSDEMGLGKTAQIITAADKVGAKRILIICPAIARVNWRNEFRKFSPHKRTVRIIDSVQDIQRKRPHLPLYRVADRETSVSAVEAELLICSYELIRFVPANIEWDILVLDECHYLKNPSSIRTQKVYGKNGLVHHCDRTWAVSGTPAPNHAGELWTLLYMFGITRLNYDQFVKRFCTFYNTSHGTNITGTNELRIEELSWELKRIMLRRLKRDVMKELPPIYFEDMVVPAGEVDLEVESSFVHYIFPHDRRKELENELRNQENMISTMIDSMPFGVKTIAALSSMNTSISTLRRYNGLQKVEAVAIIVENELRNNAYSKIVLFAIHRDVIEGLRVRLKDFKAVTLYGGTPATKRMRHIEHFQTNPHYRVFIGNIQACGVAINLTAASHVIMVESSFVPGENAQAVMRCHRIGQDCPVFVRFVSIADSIDQRITKLLKIKTFQLADIMDDQRLRPDEGFTPTNDMAHNSDIFT